VIRVALVYTVVTEPSFEPVTLEELKRHLRVYRSQDDGEITEILTAARRWVETATRRTPMKTTIDLKLDAFPADSEYISIPGPPLLSCSEDWSTEGIRYTAEDGTATTLGSSVYTVDTDSEPGRIYLAYDQTWPATRSIKHAVTVRFIAGFSSSATEATAQAAVPRELKQAIKLKAELLWGNLAPQENEIIDKRLGVLVWSASVKEAP
jgi:uncharacterized phiE125 gp8 family phage protein